MDPILVIIIFVTIFVLLFVSSGLKIIQQAETMVIERLGKYNRTLDSGINVIIPIFDKPRSIFGDIESPMYRVKMSQPQDYKNRLI